jgi:5-bromo-4-chloroindolyl phosphate hydrolysis protein
MTVAVAGLFVIVFILLLFSIFISILVISLCRDMDAVRMIMREELGVSDREYLPYKKYRGGR